jgi:hypothetical protein
MGQQTIIRLRNERVINDDAFAESTRSRSHRRGSPSSFASPQRVPYQSRFFRGRKLISHMRKRSASRTGDYLQIVFGLENSLSPTNANLAPTHLLSPTSWLCSVRARIGGPRQRGAANSVTQ